MSAAVHELPHTLAPDLEAARRFLELLDPFAARFTFQTFDDNAVRDDRSLGRVRHGTLDALAEELTRLNRRGAGVFVTVNATDFAGRMKANIVDVRAVWQEDDGKGRELPLEPQIIVETSPGRFHRYLLTVGAPLAEFDQVQQRLVGDYGSDPNAKDVGRVLRLPGFHHQKVKAGRAGGPFLVRVVHESGAPPYRWAHLVETFCGQNKGDGTRPPAAWRTVEEMVARLGRKLRSGDGRRALLVSFVAARSASGHDADAIRQQAEDWTAQWFDPDDPVDWPNIEKIIADFVKKDTGKRETRGSEFDAVQGATNDRVSLSDLFAYLPQHRYIYRPTGDLWPAESVNGCVDWPQQDGKACRPSTWLDRHQAVQQMTWTPSDPDVIEGRVVADGGWIDKAGARTFNLYRPPPVLRGEGAQAVRWRDHLRVIYPDDADYIERWLAQRLQQPGVKVNHALVLGGGQGIGKDTLLEPVKHGIGSWNWAEVSPTKMLGRFNPWVKSVVLRVNEARDLGDVDRFAFYDHSKSYIAAPPDVLSVDEKNVREHAVFNVTGVLITTNHQTDGIYLPPDDRRHYVAWSEATKDEFDAAYWGSLWQWYGSGGIGHVVAFLRALDLTTFDPKAPPPKTAAWRRIVQANAAPEDGELADVLDALNRPDAITLSEVVSAAREAYLHDLADDMADRKRRRALPHRFERVGYVVIHNPDATDGLWVIGGRRRAVYGRREVSPADQIRAARQLC